VVPPQQLPAAIGAQEARRSVVRLGGPPLGGALYALHHAVPFVVDAASYACSTAALLAMRTPFQDRRDADATPLRRQLVEGAVFLWREPFLRTCALLYGIGNVLAPAFLLAIVVLGRRHGLGAAEVGLLTAAVGAGTLVGSLASPLARRRLGVRTILLLELWTWTGAWLFLLWPSVYVLTGVVAAFGLAAPVTDSVVVGYRLALTPDRLVGRVESVRSSISLLLAPLGPLAAGALLGATSARWTVALFAALGLVLQLWGTLSPALRAAPELADRPRRLSTPST
jgi:hypothetical protein